MNADINALLSQMSSRMDEMTLATHSAIVPVTPLAVSSPVQQAATADGNDDLDTDADDAIDIYLSGMVDHVMHQYDATDEEAADVVFAAIDDAVETGKMPEMPDEGAAKDTLALWVGKASTGGLQKIVDDFAKAHAA